MCFLRISEQTATFALHNINKLSFYNKMESVYCVVGTESLYRLTGWAYSLSLFTNIYYKKIM
jgi:hypothetical protein